MTISVNSDFTDNILSFVCNSDLKKLFENFKII